MSKKVIFFAISFLLISGSTLSAAVYKGQRMYVRECRPCHGGGQNMAASKNQSDWQAIMDQDGLALAQLHTQSEKAQDSWEYFASDKYKEKAKHLRDFLVEYAKDSGKVPACN